MQEMAVSSEVSEYFTKLPYIYIQLRKGKNRTMSKALLYVTIGKRGLSKISISMRKQKP